MTTYTVVFLDLHKLCTRFCTGSVISGADRLPHGQEHPRDTRCSFFAEQDQSGLISKGDPRQERGVRTISLLTYGSFTVTGIFRSIK